MFVDKITEKIAHFIGQLKLQAELERAKIPFDAFDKNAGHEDKLNDLHNANVKVSSDLDTQDFDPHIPYLDKPLEIVGLPVSSLTKFIPIEVGLKPLYIKPYEVAVDLPSNGGGKVHFTIDPPGSVAVVINQRITLYDDDYTSVGGHGLKLMIEPGSDLAKLDSMLAEAGEYSPFTGLVPTEQGLKEFAVSAQQAVSEWTPPQGDNVFVVKAGAIEGTYVNGVLLGPDEEAPDPEDYIELLKKQKEEDEDDGLAEQNESQQTVGNTASGQGELDVNASVTVVAGSNTLVNSATINTNWATSGVLAVAGDHIELNAIIQLNGSINVDNLSQTMNGWVLDNSQAEGSFNIAMFQHLQGEPQESLPADVDPTFPSYWAVTRIDGDLTIFNQITQFTFMSDSDVTIVASSGVTSTVTVGGNTAINSISINELGLYYDLIVVGGNVYDINMIQQLNLLLDNDTVGAVSGFETTGTATYTAGNNLLWNQAAIVEVGGVGGTTPMTEPYKQTANSLAAGNDTINSGVLHDSPFAGIEFLRVLYISGDVVNINYINQVNVLGDSDTVALAMNEFVAYPEAQWTIGTGGNQLVNFASIVDVEGTMKTYVGGNSYSDEILVQGNLLEDHPVLSGSNPDQIINEAIAFLDDDADVPNFEEASAVTIVPHSSQADVMQNVLA